MDAGFLKNITPWSRGVSGSRYFPKGIINPWRIIPDYEIFLFREGRSRIIFGDTDYYFTEDTYVIIPAGLRHISYTESEKDVFLYWTHFFWYQDDEVPEKYVYYPPEKAEENKDYIIPPDIPEGIMHGRIESPDIYSLHDRMTRRLKSGLKKEREISRAMLLEILLELLLPGGTEKEVVNNDDQVAEKTRLCLNNIALQSFCTAQSIKTALDGLDLSYFHQARIFKAKFGITPQQYVDNLRVEYMKSYLNDTEMSITEIAHKMGFDGIGYFSKFFKNHVGLSAREYRKAMNNE
ncbi:MAG: helix-turn-helix domain-containing protein [Planctomycetota bacterium]|jgi:AraC-like DNA-binding protein